jgi:hypothetical protein
MNDIRRTILWVVFGFSLVMLWDQWQLHNGNKPTFFPAATPPVVAGPTFTCRPPFTPMAGSTTSVDSNDAWLLVPAFERCPWALDAATDDEAIALLARCLQLPGDFDEEARTSIWVEMLYKWLDFGKVSEMNVTKALAVMRIMVSLHVHAVGEPPPPPPSPSLRASDALILCHS